MVPNVIVPPHLSSTGVFAFGIASRVSRGLVYVDDCITAWSIHNWGGLQSDRLNNN